MKAYVRSLCIGASLIILMSAGIFAYQSRISQTIYEDSAANLYVTYEQVGRTFTLFSQRNWNVLKASAGTFYAIDDHEEDLERIWKGITEGKESWQFRNFYLFNEDSDFLTDDGKSGTADSIEGVFEDAFETSEPIATSYISSSGTRRIAYAISLSSPVELNGETYTGLAITYDNDVVQELITGNIYDNTSDCYIVKASGDVVLSLQKKTIFTDFITNICEYAEQNATFTRGSSAEVRESIASGQSGDAIISYNGTDAYLTYQPAGINDWMLVSVVDRNVVDKGMTDALSLTTAALVALSVIAALLAIGIVVWVERRKISAAENEKRIVEHDKKFVTQLFQGMGQIVERVVWADLAQGTYEYRERALEENIYPVNGTYEELVEAISQRYVAIGDVKDAKLSNLLSAASLQEALPAGCDAFRFEYCSRKQDAYSLMTIVALERDEAGIASKVMLIGQDIGQKIELQNAANTDSLTGLFNERYFSKVLHAKAVRKEPFVLFYLDLDRFKPVNDTYGHDTGDKLLRAVAQRLQTCIRAHDHAFRIGGDEFAIIVAASYSEELCEKMTERIANAIAEPFVIDGTFIEVGTSCGYAHFPGEGDPNQVRILADKRMYETKTAHHSQNR